MATIEERAKDFAKEKCKCDRCRFCYDYVDSTCDKYNLYVKLYKEIATEQKKENIEKLKDIMNRLMLDTKDKAEIIKEMEG